MSRPTPAVVCTALGFAWPDGTPALTDLDVSFDTGRTGLIGRNGSGKSTLLRLIAGRLRPSTGTITTAGDVQYLPQELPLDTGRIGGRPARHRAGRGRRARDLRR